ncbi:MAG: 2-octaprenyl-6-methoxyphenyl hydroxylase protein [Moraxellaceae bacterium]|nr:2-octaprenyl-6-methoxyphenyl hydroxylase protein [Moraxellaceae bacterium]
MTVAAAAGTDTDVLIIGGGMVGVTLALLLARAPGLRITLVEAIRFPELAPDAPLPYRPSFDARNTALSRRTVATYRELGLWDEMQTHANPILQIHVSERGHFGMARLVAEEEKVESFGQVIENAWMGLVLLRALRSCANVTVLDGVQLTGIVPGETSVTAQLRRGDEPLLLSAPLLVAADGAQSVSRRFLGVNAETRSYGQVALVTTVATHLPHDNIAFERFTEHGPIAVLPLPDERRAVVWTLPQGQEKTLIDCSDKEFLLRLQAAFGKRAGRFVKTAPRFAYPLALTVAQTQALPRAVILGNAAHTLHPVAGQGFNLCLRDCLALNERLQKAWREGRDLGDFALLKDYEAVRHPDQLNVIRFSDSIVRGFSNNLPGLTLARNIGMVTFDLLPAAKQALARYAMGLNQ